MIEVSTAPTVKAVAGIEWPVVVVGAGMAGSCVAASLAARGIRVLLIEKEKLGRNKACGGCLNARSLGSLRRLRLGGVVDSARLNRLDGIELREGCARVSIPFPPAHPGHSVSRAEFDAALAREAVRRGAVLLTGVRVTGTRLECSRRVVRIRGAGGPEREIAAEIVVGCDGLCSGLARAAGLVSEETGGGGPRLGASALLPCEAFDLPEHWITMAGRPEGYAGVVRVDAGGDRGYEMWNVAGALRPVFVRDQGGPWKAMTSILESCGIAVCAHIPGDVVSCPGLRWSVRRPWAERLLLVGDAAGYVEPITGEGMAWALEAAEEAVALAAEGWSDATGPKYEAQWRSRVGSRRIARVASRVLDSPFLSRATLGLMRAVPPVGRALVSRLNRISVPEAVP